MKILKNKFFYLIDFFSIINKFQIIKREKRSFYLFIY